MSSGLRIANSQMMDDPMAHAEDEELAGLSSNDQSELAYLLMLNNHQHLDDDLCNKADGSMAHTDYWRSCLTEQELTGRSTHDQALLDNHQYLVDLETSNQMEDSIEHAECWRSYLTERELAGQSTNDHSDYQTYVEGESAASTGKKQRIRGLKLTPANEKNNVSDRNYRLRLKEKYNRMMKIASECGGIDEMVSEFQTLKQMKSKYGRIEEIQSKLNKLEQMEAESAVFEQVKTMFGGIHNVALGLDRLKKTEFQHTLSKPNQMEGPFIDFLQEEYNHGAQSVTSNNQEYTGEGGLQGDNGISQVCLAFETPFSDVLVIDFIAKLEKDTRSIVNFSSFKNLDGERQRVGDYSFPVSLVSTVKAITEAHGDVTENCVLGPSVVENSYILLCAAIKEMGDLSLKQVTEEMMLKWRDAIKDARRIGCDVEFAWKHLKTIAYAYFGLKARKYRISLKQRMANLIAAENFLRQELDDKFTSSQCRMCLEIADCFRDKNVGLFG